MNIKKIVRLIIPLSIVVLLGAAVFASARLVTSYSNDKDTYRFTFDVKDTYGASEAKDAQISFIDTTTGQKPIGTAVTMRVNGGPETTVLSADSRTTSRFVNLGNLSEGEHSVVFSAPGACGNFFDFSAFEVGARFDTIYDCQYRINFAVGDAEITPSDSEPIDGCTNPVATNYNPDATNNNGSCTFEPGLVVGCTDTVAVNYVSTAVTDDGSCIYYTYGCTDTRATNYSGSANAEDGSCTYPGEVTDSDFECSINNTTWSACEGRTFTLQSPDTPIYVQTESRNAGTWSDWCTGDINNGVQASFSELTSNGDNAEVTFDIDSQGSLFDMVLCLNPDSATSAQSFKNIKIKLLDTQFIEN